MEDFLESCFDGKNIKYVEMTQTIGMGIILFPREYRKLYKKPSAKTKFSLVNK